MSTVSPTLTRLSCGHLGRLGEFCVHPTHEAPVRVNRNQVRDRAVGLAVAFGFPGAVWFGLIWAVTR